MEDVMTEQGGRECCLGVAAVGGTRFWDQKVCVSRRRSDRSHNSMKGEVSCMQCCEQLARLPAHCGLRHALREASSKVVLPFLACMCDIYRPSCCYHQPHCYTHDRQHRAKRSCGVHTWRVDSAQRLQVLPASRGAARGCELFTWVER